MPAVNKKCLSFDISLCPWSSSSFSSSSSFPCTVGFTMFDDWPKWKTLSKQFQQGCICNGYESYDNNTDIAIANCPTAIKIDVAGYMAMILAPTYRQDIIWSISV